MTAAEIAIGISGISLLISMFLAGWTVYRDAIQKPKFRVTISVRSVVQQNRDTLGPDIHIDALNLGPLPNRAEKALIRRGFFSRIIRDRSLAVIIPDYTHIAHTARHERTEVGDSVTFVFPFTASFPQEGYSQVGVCDGYGKIHWVSAKAYGTFLIEYRNIADS